MDWMGRWVAGSLPVLGLLVGGVYPARGGFRLCHRLKRLGWWAAIVAALVPLVAPPSRADTVPDTGCSGRRCYLSADPTPVAVDVFIETEPDKSTRMVLPRAYIMTASGYDQRAHAVLPESIRTQGLELNLMWPDARPYSSELEDMRHAKRPAGASPVLDLRMRRIRVEIGRIGAKGSMAGFVELYRGKSYHLAEPFEGLEHRHDKPPPGSARHSYDYYVGEFGKDFFSIARCSSDAKPTYYCSYHVQIAPDLHIEAHFSDFRFHGGRSFANERMSFVYRTICAATPACRANSREN